MVLFKCPHSHQAGVIVNLSWITIQTPSRSRKWKMKNEPQWANSSSSSLPLFIHDEDNISSSHVVSRTDDCGWPLSVTIAARVFVTSWTKFRHELVSLWHFLSIARRSVLKQKITAATVQTQPKPNSAETISLTEIFNSSGQIIMSGLAKNT